VIPVRFGERTPQTLGAQDLSHYLFTRWRFLAIACGTALVLSIVVSLFMTRQYTATVSIVIDPPAGSDPRASTAISPIYLESLRTYEYYAEGDSLFAEAVEKFHLRVKGTESVETLKQKILRVAKVKDSKILQIRTTLPDPQKAMEVAQFISGEVVKISHRTGAGIDQGMREGAERQLAQWKTRRQRALDAYADFQAHTPVEAMRGEVDSLQGVLGKVLNDAMSADADAEDYAARQALHEVAAAARARAAVLHRQVTETQNSLTAKGGELAKRSARRKQLEEEIEAAKTGVEAEERHVRELQDMAGGRGEVLTIIDPGFLPQRPSSPNLLLNVIAALFSAAILALLYLVFTFGRLRYDDR
jgi:capsular polysaccharide biosynthesis protein